MVENGRGILASSFRIFEKTINLCPEKVDIIIFHVNTLLIWLRRTTGVQYITRKCVDFDNTEESVMASGLWHTQFLQTVSETPNVGNSIHSREDYAIREHYIDDFMGPEVVPHRIK
jgi:hypothetical protein